MTESDHGTTIIKQVVAITRDGETSTQPWTVEPTKVLAKPFAAIYTGDYRAQTYFNGHFTMVNQIKKLRDAKSVELMHGLDTEENNPNGSDSNHRPEGSLRAPKRELIDKIPRVLELEVATSNGWEATVNVLSSRRGKSVLQIELTNENIDLLLEGPPTESVQFTPTICGVNCPDVTWYSPRNHLRCTYWNSKKQTWTIKSKLIEFDANESDEQRQELVDKEANALQAFFVAHHNQLGDLPQDDESAESAPEEPPAKAARCHE